MRGVALGAVVLVAACGGESDSITVELEELRGSGISGTVRLEPELDFRRLREWDPDHALAAAFMRDGRYVACGES